MSTILEAARARKEGTATFAPPRPQVNLLPPEVTAARGLHRLKRWLLLSIAIALLVLALMYVVAVLRGAQARAELVVAEQETQRLLAEQAKYAEVPIVLNSIGQTSRARELGMSTEIRWRTYYDAIAAVLPEGVSIDSLSFTGESPLAAGPAAGSPLEGPSVGQIQFTGRTVTVPDSAAWVDALSSVPGFSDPWVSALTLTADDAGTPYFTVSATIRVTSDAYTNRFAPVAPGAAEEG
ncbi:PilN domain-containing protein [Cellulomonas xiejunii]|uniref:Fimbrial assembly protein n=1 Tax=Cellulomonas xiejunii TaxID=2968083 RepID=A0ABY5KSW9_9CELL|nr:PilN domain-containing protein [Cellulomonas xiejunii]MCC2314820.1 fimbrial assembly protein [Cellulomonas xiejunii]MCC2323102.1 fimbrial assembly protein [Cellulomonas xiejunii]UUI73592.1 fimbrial assembly protein [Cellulomonas xiejunii]